MSATLVYDPEGANGAPVAFCSDSECAWRWVDAQDLNAVMALWVVHARTCHTVESETEALRRETEALRVEVEQLRASTERRRLS